jgi:acyl-CoA synthetase (AMP-forming)/AMP-acid ligase II
MATQAERSAHHRALDQGTAPGVFQFTAKRVPHRLALKTLDGSLELTWGEYDELVRKTAAGLAALGLQKGDTIAIMLVNRPEFHIVDSAAMHLGATPFSLRMRRRRSRCPSSNSSIGSSTREGATTRSSTSW